MTTAYLTVAASLVALACYAIYRDRPWPSRRDLAMVVAVVVIAALTWPAWSPIAAVMAWRKFS